MRLHLLGIPHTVTNDEFSHCAFTGKVKRFSPMMRSVGFEVIHYGVSGAESGANINIDVLTREEQEELIGKYDPKSSDFVGNKADVRTPLYRKFNDNLASILHSTVQDGEIVCLPFGKAHQQALTELKKVFYVETGIGYPDPYVSFRVYESFSQLHRVAGQQITQGGSMHGSNYHWVIPNYYDVSQWKVRNNPGQYVLFMGRITDIKGLPTIVELAKKMPNLDFVLAGQGDPKPYLTAENIKYIGPVSGKERSALFENAIATLCPSKFYEPFCGVAVESMLCGTPVLSVSYGAFTETIIQGKTGFRCQTLGDWVEALNRVMKWGPKDWLYISNYARKKYDMYNLAQNYKKVFQQVSELAGSGWYSDSFYI